VAANHFLVNFADDVGDVESILFLGNLRMEEDLEEQVAEFFGKFGVIGGFESIEDFVSFFDEVSAERGVGLFAIPAATARSAKTGHKGDEFLEGVAGVGRMGKFGFRFARGARGGLSFALGLARHLVAALLLVG
jgi:hypothetical protein